MAPSYALWLLLVRPTPTREDDGDTVLATFGLLVGHSWSFEAVRTTDFLEGRHDCARAQGRRLEEVPGRTGVVGRHEMYCAH
jgi:hypothetical protein